jgi:POT family proton-dependent oligopeptide transporter
MFGLFPPQIKYILGNEACERFSYYGMRSILVIFMVQKLLMPESEAKGLYHLFLSACYFLPLLGGFLSDRYWGKYNTIIWLSIVYSMGHGVLALWESKTGLYVGLALIALGAGGIKPCISSHVGDQFTEKNSHLIEKVYEIFYWSVNFGAFFSTLLIPWVLVQYGQRIAFAIPGVLMVIATVIFWMGKKHFVIVPPTGKAGSNHFLGVVCYALARIIKKKPGESWLEVAKELYSVDQVEGAKAVFQVFTVFASVTVFWSLYDQTGSTWVLQAEQMDLNFMGIKWESSQIQALNSILILVLVPFYSLWVYPFVQKMGYRLTPLRKMGAGMVIMGFSFVWITIIQLLLESGVHLSVGWQFGPYFILSSAEILISITGLEFAYTQAPRAMKGTLMSIWLITIALGNFVTAIISYINPFSGGVSEFFFYTVLMALLAVVFIWTATRYQGRDYLEPAA